jgi:glycerol-3-phosphate dehydrogenase (NAD(P)+)
MKITVVGSGGWGTALAILLHKNGHQVTVWSYSQSEVDYIRENHENALLKGVTVPEDIQLTTDISAVKDADFVVSAVPSFAVRSTAKSMAPYLTKDSIIVSVTKGIERDTSNRMSQILQEETGAKIAVLSGPTHAEEVGRGIPTGCVVACEDHDIVDMLQDAFMSDVFRVYASGDMVGVELGAALKNIYALIAGVLEGAGCGDNTKALMMTRGLTESARLGVALGAKQETFAGLSGVGDLIVTCCSMHSRNHRCGIYIGEGMTAKDAMDKVGAVVEGYYATASAHQLAEKYGIEMPIADAAYQVLYGNGNVQEAIGGLMRRQKRHEIDEIWLEG